MRKLVLGLFIVSLSMIFMACTGQAFEGFQLNSTDEVIAFQALSSIEMLDEQPTTTVASTRFRKMSDTEDVTTLDQIEPYLELFEQLLTQNNGLSVETTVSDREAYAVKQTFTTTDLLGNSSTYTLYYNELEVVVDESDDDSNDDEDDDHDEQAFRFEGILISGDQTFTVSGKNEVEDDETKIKFTATNDLNQRVEVVHKLEDEEQKFEYSFYQDEVLSYQSKIKIENEDNEFKIVLEYQEGNNSGKYTFKLENEDDQSVMKIKFYTDIDGVVQEGEARVLVVVDELTGETTYSIWVKGIDDDEEHEENYDRDRDDDDDEDDDEDEDDDNEQEDEHEDEEDDNEDSLD